MNINQIKFSLSNLALPVVSLIGPPGSGKTEVGSLLATSLGWTFWDTDVLIEQALGLTIPEIFSEYGQHTFRFSEKKLIETMARLYRTALESQDKTSHRIAGDTNSTHLHGTVISTGGGLPVLGENFSVLSRIGTLITLYASIDILAERIARKPNRPLLNPSGLSSSGHDQQQPLKALVEGRKHVYAQANISIDTSELSATAVVESIKEKLKLQITA